MVKLIQIQLNKKTYKADKRFKLIKGNSYQNPILGISRNTERYVQINDLLVLNKKYFNQEYKFKVITINLDKHDNVVANIQSEEFIPKHILGNVKEFILSTNKEKTN